MKRNFMRIIVIALIAALLVPSTALAASKRPYKDVSKDQCGKQYTKAINEYAKHGDLKKVVKGKKFKPFKIATHEFTVKVLEKRLEKTYGHDAVLVIPPKYMLMNEHDRLALSTHDWTEQFLVDVAAFGYGEEIIYPKEETREKIAELQEKEATPKRVAKIKKLKKKLRKLEIRGKKTEDRGCTICEFVNWEAVVRPGNCTPIHP